MNSFLVPNNIPDIHFTADCIQDTDICNLRREYYSIIIIQYDPLYNWNGSMAYYVYNVGN